MNFVQKVRILSFCYLLFFILIFLRLVYWQVFQSGEMSAVAEDQHFATLLIPTKRGEIKTSDGYILASNKEAYLLYANLNEIPPNRPEIAKLLAPILASQIPLVATDEARITPIDREEFYKKETASQEATITTKLSNQKSFWVNLFHFVDRDAKQKISDLKTKGLGFADEQTRDYPEASMAAHLLGLVGFDSVGNPQGYFGLEGTYDRELSGMPGEIKVERDALGRPIAIGEEIRRESQDGRNLILTINRAVQKSVENNLEAGIVQWEASGGTAIVMDPNDGSIIAMANFPRYDPGKFGYYPPDLFRNPAISDLYEPGSIFKPLVVAAAINENAITPDTRCDKCAGPRQIENDFIHTFDNKYHPNLTATEVLINSDNTGMVFIGEKLGFSKLYQYVKNYGFGQKTGVDLQGEEEGSLRAEADYYPIDKATLNFGQGIAVNALQIMRAWSALANGGVLVTPHLVSEIKSNTRSIPLSWPTGERVISSETSRMVAEMLTRVTRESPIKFPLERTPQIMDFRISAKSGTAQIALGGKYKEKGTTASVIGFFPTNKPRFLVMVKLNEPELRIWGSDTAGPIFMSILRDLVSYYGMTP